MLQIDLQFEYDIVAVGVGTIAADRYVSAFTLKIRTDLNDMQDVLDDIGITKVTHIDLQASSCTLSQRKRNLIILFCLC